MTDTERLAAAFALADGERTAARLRFVEMERRLAALEGRADGAV